MIISFSEEKPIEQEKGRQWYGACESKLEIEVVLYDCWVICSTLKVEMAVGPTVMGHLLELEMIPSGNTQIHK